ncbi:MAG: hypothetical protein OSB67_07530 [Alphaproteobacteria bacterium]|nr:hypothetical protein [Alphaproteobacteria bacterium]
MTFTIYWRGLLIGLFAILLAACTQPVSSPQFPQLTFTHLPSIQLDARTLTVVDNYLSAERSGVTQGIPIPLDVVVHQWARDRLVPAGKNGEIVVTITEASIIETTLERTKGVRGFVTTDQSERYDGRLGVKIEIRDAAAQRVGDVSAVALRSRTVAEDLTLNERDRVLFAITEAMINDLNSELEKAIGQFLLPFVIR